MKLVGNHLYSKSYSFGVYLGFNTNVLNALRKANSQDLKEFFIDICSQWLNDEEGTGQKLRTWRTVIEAVRHCDNPALAEEVTQVLTLENEECTSEIFHIIFWVVFICLQLLVWCFVLIHRCRKMF